MAWAYVVADAEGRPQRWEAGPLGTATNNIAELTALQELLESVDPAVALEVRMDSQYAMNAVTKWLPGWKRNGWKTSAYKPVANRELVTRIDELLGGRAVTFVYVPAHQVDGDPLNALADQAASEVAVSQSAAGDLARLGRSRPRPLPRHRGPPDRHRGEDGGRHGAHRRHHPGQVRGPLPLREAVRRQGHDREERPRLGPPGVPHGLRLTGSGAAASGQPPPYGHQVG